MKSNNQQYAFTQITFLFECFSMCWHKLLYLNVSLIQHGTVSLEKKCVVTSLLADVRNRWIVFLNRFNEPNCPKRTRGRKWIGLHHYCTLVIAMQKNHYCADSDSKRISTVQTRAPSESLLHRLKLQMNHYCTDSSSKWITTVQTHTSN